VGPGHGPLWIINYCRRDNSPDGQLSPIHGFSALSTIELNPTPRLNVYFNYGGDYLDRDYVLNGTTQVGYGNRSAAMTSCFLEPNPGNGGSNQSAAPTGAGSSCAGNNKDVQEGTIGYWYNLYNGPKGRLRQGIQYSYIVRNLWSGTAALPLRRAALRIPMEARRAPTTWCSPRSATTCRKRLSSQKQKGAAHWAAPFLVSWSPTHSAMKLPNGWGTQIRAGFKTADWGLCFPTFRQKKAKGRGTELSY